MRVVDLQMSVSGSIPAGVEVGSLHAAQGYRFYKDVDHARKLNLQRQESVLAPNSTGPTLLIQESIPSPARLYVNRAKKDGEGSRREEERPLTRYQSMSSRRSEVRPRGQEIDFLA